MVMDEDVRLNLHIPEPKFRPGDQPDFSYLTVPAAGSVPRPEITSSARELDPFAYTLIRVLDDQGQAVGPWSPNVDPETLRRGLRAMMLTRAYDERMFRALCQGTTSFYIHSPAQEAILATMAPAI